MAGVERAPSEELLTVYTSLVSHVAARARTREDILRDVAEAVGGGARGRRVAFTRYSGFAYEPVGSPETPLAAAKELLELYGTCQRVRRDLMNKYYSYVELLRKVRRGELAKTRERREALNLLSEVRALLLDFYSAGCVPGPPRTGQPSPPRALVRMLDDLLRGVAEGRLDPFSDRVAGAVSAAVRGAYARFKGSHGLEGFMAAQGLLPLVREIRRPERR